MDDEKTRPKKELPEDTAPTPKRQAELLEAIHQNVLAGKVAGENIIIHTRGELQWLQDHLPLDETEPTPERQAELRKIYKQNSARRTPPYQGAKIQSKGELLWVIQERSWQKAQADFRDTYFENTNLSGCNLAFANLTNAHFHRVNLSNSDLNGSKLYGADLARVNFRGANLSFSWMDSDTNLNGILIDTKTRFRSTRWNAVSLSLVDWDQMPRLGDEEHARQTRAKKGADKGELLDLYQAAAGAYRQLASALRGQGLTEASDRFTYRGLLMQRKTLWWQLRNHKFGKLGSYLFSWFLAILTGYGFRMWRIMVAYVLIICSFALAYQQFGLMNSPNNSWSEAFVLSITAFHGRVFSSPFTLGSPQGWVTAIEAIFGLVVEGVFIAMLTQRFFNR